MPGPSARKPIAKAIELMGRPGRAEDIAPVVAFLCSPASARIAGENIRVDGALRATRSMARSARAPESRITVSQRIDSGAAPLMIPTIEDDDDK